MKRKSLGWAMVGFLALSAGAAGAPQIVRPAKAPALAINAAYAWRKWDNRRVGFILVKRGESNYLIAEGTGISPETKARMGTIDLVTDQSQCTGLRGVFHVPYEAATNYVRFTRGAETAQSPMPVKIAGWPAWDTVTTSAIGAKMKIVLNTEYELRGYELTPRGIPGLVYTLDFNFTAGLPLRIQILEHTENWIRFKIVATGSLPKDFMNSSEFNPNVGRSFFLNGRYEGGVPVQLISQLYYLAMR